MNLSRRSLHQILASTILILVPMTIIIYLLRGLSILAGMSGGVILLLLLLSCFAIVGYGLEKTR
ncbi:hypothetical protein GLO73106DRAFT_00034560 [Gloeocapsa sp. PCC 73106]|nr:hypothetical protein GLO73106DRAFT_00034560 [Gloeocapsa sp. PCC 73106]